VYVVHRKFIHPADDFVQFHFLVFVKKNLEKVCFVSRFVDILDGQENVARDARARALARSQQR
jgi:hypothetical protein